MKRLKRMLCAILLVVLLLTVAMPSLAEISIPKKYTYYLYSKDGSVESDDEYFPVYGYDTDNEIKGLASSKPAVLKIRGLSTYLSGTIMLDDGSQSWYSSLNIVVRPKKAGKSVIALRIDDNIYTSTVTVKKYTNPIKKLVLTGVSNKNLASKFAKSCEAYMELDSDTVKGNLKLTAASGWKIKSVYWSGIDNGVDISNYFGKPVSSVTMSIPAMKAAYGYMLFLDFVNTKNGAALSCYYEIGEVY